MLQNCCAISLYRRIRAGNSITVALDLFKTHTLKKVCGEGKKNVPVSLTVKRVMKRELPAILSEKWRTAKQNHMRTIKMSRRAKRFKITYLLFWSESSRNNSPCSIFTHNEMLLLYKTFKMKKQRLFLVLPF